MTVRWGVLGAGWIVQTATAQALRGAPNAHLAAVASRDTERARALQPERVHASYSNLIEDDDIDAVYIALANDQHGPWIHEAISAGKHVLCEKPLTMDPATTRELFRAADDAGVLLVEAAWSMWHPRMRRIVELVTSGLVGDVEEFLGTFTFEGVPDGNYRLDPARGGGALLDIGVYPLHALVGCLPDLIDPHIDVERTLGGLGVDLTTRARMTFDQGTRASVVASFAMPESQRLLIRGSEARIQVPDEQAFTSWQIPTSLLVGDHEESFPATDAYRDMFAAVSSRILGGSDWVLSPEASVRVADLVESLR
ncbi:MAG: Gfo/Idh/MocA family oxidoreductase [Candidatus Nanopelagicales bacterium]|nr:Gfo/Idh/MocA family oxidoreductase [Candidatus Nanopelagicales bacterium]